MAEARRVLFICTANDVRSQMAEALLRSMRPKQYSVYSAGVRPTQAHPEALEWLEKMGVDTTGLYSKPLTEFEGQHFDFVICLCNKAQAESGPLYQTGEFMVWDFEDPLVSRRQGAMMRTLEEVRRRIHMFLLVTEKQPQPEGIYFHIPPELRFNPKRTRSSGITRIRRGYHFLNSAFRNRFFRG